MYTTLIKKVSWINYQNYVLQNNEAGYDITTKELKIGNGVNTWAELSIAKSSSVDKNTGVGAIDLANIPEVDNIDSPTEESATAVRYNGEIYLLVEGEINDGI